MIGIRLVQEAIDPDALIRAVSAADKGAISLFLGTVREGTLACTARPVHLGRTTHVWDATVYRGADRRTIALFRCTQMILYAAR